MRRKHLQRQKVEHQPGDARYKPDPEQVTQKDRLSSFLPRPDVENANHCSREKICGKGEEREDGRDLLVEIRRKHR
jgi:hypothetical protein